MNKDLILDLGLNPACLENNEALIERILDSAKLPPEDLCEVA